jgi:glutamate racemase
MPNSTNINIDRQLLDDEIGRYKPIAVFDSGVGGLTVAQHIRALLPQADLLYFADCDWAPYGSRPPEQIIHRVMAIAQWLIAQQSRTLVVACNTATTLAIGNLRAHFPELPIVGVEPGVQPAIKASCSGIVGILATNATLQSAWFNALLARQSKTVKFICQAGHGLVELIEQGHADSVKIDALLSQYLLPMCEAGADTLVLGSTHFPLLTPAIRRCVGQRLTLIDTGLAVARRVAALAGPGDTQATGRCKVITTALSPILPTLAAAMLGTVGHQVMALPTLSA